MHIKTRNINSAFRTLVTIFANEYSRGEANVDVVKQSSRNGNVLMIQEPVTITYSHPRERVLFNESRDANCFMHLYEALWMLAGRNDVAPMCYYASKMKDFSDNYSISRDDELGMNIVTGTFNGAYGYRWRCAAGVPELWMEDRNIGDQVTSKATTVEKVRGYKRPGVDQLNILVEHLKAAPDSRRAVLQMWNIEDDLLKIGSPCPDCNGIGGEARDTGGVEPWGAPTPEEWIKCPTCDGKKLVKQSRDTCCNLSVMFSLRQPSVHFEEPKPGVYVDNQMYLDMTVTNRSNDLIWGCLGANVVHFSVLQEYMAARLSCKVGVYHHFTNNLHVYSWNWEPDKWLGWKEYHNPNQPTKWCYDLDLRSIPLVKNPEVFEREMPELVRIYDGGKEPPIKFEEPFLMNVAQPMMLAFRAYKNSHLDLALEFADQIQADDWRLVAKGWIERRKAKREAKAHD